MVVTHHQVGNDKMAQKTAIDKLKAINTKEERFVLLEDGRQ